MGPLRLQSVFSASSAACSAPRQQDEEENLYAVAGDLKTAVALPEGEAAEVRERIRRARVRARAKVRTKVGAEAAEHHLSRPRPL